MEILNARERAILWLKTATFIYIPAISIYFLAYAIGQADPKGLLLGLYIPVPVARIINITGFLIGWIGTWVSARTLERCFLDSGAGRIAAGGLYLALAAVSFILYV